MYEDFINFVQDVYSTKEFIPLHEPRFIGNEKKYLNECIDSTFVSSVGEFVDRFEQEIAIYTGAKYAIATVNGTAALHISLILADVQRDDEVITQPLTFIATCNAISYCGATPVFVDVDKDTLGMSPDALRLFLEENAQLRENKCFNKVSGKVIKACVPMHTFGHPCRIEEIKIICEQYHIALVEDAAESLGSYYNNKHTGLFGAVGVISFNGNKIITAGGGGCIITDNEELAVKAKHLTTTAKMPHKWAFTHDVIGYNYRMPNINAALLLAQLENIEVFLDKKHELSALYRTFFKQTSFRFVNEPEKCKSNYWLNALILNGREERDVFLEETNNRGVMTRPVWALMNRLDMFRASQCGNLDNAIWLESRVVNIPSSVRV